MELNELALFAGAGGGLIGTRYIGLNTLCAVEINSHCRQVLIQRQSEKLLHNFPIWNDVCNFDGKSWHGNIDIVTGGFPCQPFSTAARGRNNAIDFWPEMRRIIFEVNSEYVFAENVSKKAIEIAANDCAAMGYKAEMLALSASDLGADHVRERYWFLAYSNDKSKLCSTVNAKMAQLPKFCEGLWGTFSNNTRMVNGMARRMERYRAVGNGQVPAVAATALWVLANAS